MGEEGTLPLSAWFWTFGGPVILAVQVACLIHVVKTGRPYWWIWLIFGFPVVGVAAYVYLELRPAWGKTNWQSLLWKLKTPQQRIGILRSELAESNTIKNRLALADELHAARLFDEEGQVLGEGLRSAFQDDATLLLRLAESHLEAGRTIEAQQILAKTVPEASRESQAQFALLRARILGRLGDGDAELAFAELLARRKSEAPRYYYAEFLLHSGRRDEAVAILKDILHQYRRGTPVWRYVERRWYRAARQALKQAPAQDRQPPRSAQGSLPAEEPAAPKNG